MFILKRKSHFYSATGRKMYWFFIQIKRKSMSALLWLKEWRHCNLHFPGRPIPRALKKSMPLQTFWSLSLWHYAAWTGVWNYLHILSSWGRDGMWLVAVLSYLVSKMPPTGTWKGASPPELLFSKNCITHFCVGSLIEIQCLHQEGRGICSWSCALSITQSAPFPSRHCG